MKTPWHLWAVGGVALAAHGLGCLDYVMTQVQGDAWLAHMEPSPALLAWFHAMPAWVVAAWALAVWGGLAGAVLLFLRRRLALYAFAYERAIGVDIEYMRPLSSGEYIDLARHFFSPGECATLDSLPESARRQAFFNCWTRKESYIKARGMGLSIPLDSFDVSLAPAEPAALLASRDAPDTVANWSLRALTVPADYAAALLKGYPKSCLGGPRSSTVRPRKA